MDARRFFTGAGLAAAGLWAARAWTRWRRRIELADRVVVITGGSRGLGLELARPLAREGARLCLLARSSEELEQARREIRKAAPQAPDVLALTCDMTDPAAVGAAFDRIVRERGTVDVLVNNAGTIQVGPARHMRRADFEQALAIHFWGPLYAIDAVVPRMREQGGGRIVNVSSIGGKVGIPHMAPYCASKHALVGLSDGLQADLEREGIRITTVCPGLMRTGSHLNVDVRGQHEAEYAWFAIADALPGLSMSVRRAARRIVRACRYGDRQLVIGLPARLAIVADALAPELCADATALLERLVLPSPAERGSGSRSGWQSRSSRVPAWLTRSADRAAVENNELAGRSPRELGFKVH